MQGRGRVPLGGWGFSDGFLALTGASSADLFVLTGVGAEVAFDTATNARCGGADGFELSVAIIEAEKSLSINSGCFFIKSKSIFASLGFFSPEPFFLEEAAEAGVHRGAVAAALSGLGAGEGFET